MAVVGAAVLDTLVAPARVVSPTNKNQLEVISNLIINVRDALQQSQLLCVSERLFVVEVSTLLSTMMDAKQLLVGIVWALYESTILRVGLGNLQAL